MTLDPDGHGAAATDILDDAPRSGTQGLGRLGPLLLLATLSWSLPAAAAPTLLQALFDGGIDKVTLAATVSTAAALAATCSTIVTGALSDRTRTRYGRRKPWILGGAIVGATSLTFMTVAYNFAVVVICFCGFQIGLTAMAAALAALLPDRVEAGLLGRASSMGGLGNLLGTALAGFAAAAYIDVPRVGMAVIPWLMVVAAVVICWTLPTEPSPPPAGTWTMSALLASMRPPADRDFWLAFLGRLTFLMSLLTVVAYQLYLLTDYFHLPKGEAARTIAHGGLILAAGAGIAAIVSGPLSDRLRRRKPFVATACLVGASGTALPLAYPTLSIYLVYVAVVALAYGTFISVDQALMVEVLPTATNNARDLGFLAAASTAPGVLAPTFAGVLVSGIGYPALFVGGIACALVSACSLLAIRRVR